MTVVNGYFVAAVAIANRRLSLLCPAGNLTCHGLCFSWPLFHECLGQQVAIGSNTVLWLALSFKIKLNQSVLYTHMYHVEYSDR